MGCCYVLLPCHHVCYCALLLILRCCAAGCRARSRTCPGKSRGRTSMANERTLSKGVWRKSQVGGGHIQQCVIIKCDNLV